jgi:hypothetical protein
MPYALGRNRPRRGLYTTGRGKLNAAQEKPVCRKFQVEKRGGTPYRTRSYLCAARPWETEAARKQVFPPAFLVRKVREEHAVGLSA